MNTFKTQTTAAAQLRHIVAFGSTALLLALLPMGAQAEITQDCILEGTVDKRKAEQLGQPVYVKFRNARRGSEAGCSMNRRNKSRRVKFISSPKTNDIENVDHGSQVRYRYIERDNQTGTWELIDVS
ncbi:MAG: hypothetical protein AB8B57_16735 [Congregibacter sp.]